MFARLSPRPVLHTWFMTMQREGNGVTSAVSIALGEDLNPSPEDAFDLRWSLNSMYIGSVDSVSCDSTRRILNDSHYSISP